MFVKEAVALADKLQNNAVPFEAKLKWLADFDNSIYSDIILTHADAPKDYEPIKDEESMLLIDSPYDDVYIHLIHMRVDKTNNETVRYANSKQLFEEAYNAFAAYYNRTHMPLERAYVRFF